MLGYNRFAAHDRIAWVQQIRRPRQDGVSPGGRRGGGGRTNTHVHTSAAGLSERPACTHERTRAQQTRPASPQFLSYITPHALRCYPRLALWGRSLRGGVRYPGSAPLPSPSWLRSHFARHGRPTGQHRLSRCDLVYGTVQRHNYMVFCCMACEIWSMGLVCRNKIVYIRCALDDKGTVGLEVAGARRSPHAQTTLLSAQSRCSRWPGRCDRAQGRNLGLAARGGSGEELRPATALTSLSPSTST